MTTLDKLLTRNDLVIVDPSSGKIENKSYLNKAIKKAGSYDSINPKLLRKGKIEIEKLSYIFGFPSAMTIPEITSELRGLCGFIKGLNSTLSRNYQEIDANPIAKSNKMLLDKIQEASEKIWTTSQRKQLQIRDSRYDILVEMVKLLSKRLNLKKVSKKQRCPKNPYDSDTDEKIVAAIYLEHLFDQTEPALLANDEDFLRLLGVTPRILGSEEFKPYNIGFRECFSGKKLKFYRSLSTNECTRTLEKPIRRYHTVMGLRRKVNGKELTKSEKVEIAQKLDYLWQQFSKAS